MNLTRPFSMFPALVTTHKICSLPTYNALLYIVQDEAASMHAFGAKESERKFCINLYPYQFYIENYKSKLMASSLF